MDLLRSADDGEALLAELAANGPVPDWVQIGPTGWHPAPDRPAQSGYDALRTALFLIWSGRKDHPVVSRAAAVYRSVGDPAAPIPTVVSLLGKEIIAASDLPGYRAVAALVLGASEADPRGRIPAFSADQPYYPATLHLFAQIASRVARLPI